jgi:hypothetical protein
MLAPPGPFKVNVEVVMVAGFIALLNVALMMAVVEQRPVLPFAGVTRITVGGVVGGVASAFLSGSPHPARKLRKRSTMIQIILLLLLVRIHTSYSILS